MGVFDFVSSAVTKVAQTVQGVTNVLSGTGAKIGGATGLNKVGPTLAPIAAAVTGAVTTAAKAVQSLTPSGIITGLAGATITAVSRPSAAAPQQAPPIVPPKLAVPTALYPMGPGAYPAPGAMPGIAPSVPRFEGTLPSFPTYPQAAPVSLGGEPMAGEFDWNKFFQAAAPAAQQALGGIAGGVTARRGTQYITMPDGSVKKLVSAGAKIQRRRRRVSRGGISASKVMQMINQANQQTQNMMMLAMMRG